jgi:predicted HTH domain antitoxin
MSMVLIAIRPADLVEAGLYSSEEEIIQAALGHLLEDRPDLRIDLAIYEYDIKGEISLGKAAEIAGITRWEMMDIMASRGVELRLGPATKEEAREEIKTVERWFREHPR